MTDEQADLAAGAARGEGLAGKVVAGLGWKMTSQVVLQGTRILGAVLLARLLSPREFGLAAMVLVFAALALVLSDVALGAALVRRPVVTEKDRSTAFWITMIVGVCLTGAGVGLSGPIASFYGEPDVQPLLAVAALGFVVTAAGATQAALLTRAMDFRSLELRMMAGTLLGAAVAVAVASLGYGAWAIIAQELTLVVVSTTIMWCLSSWRPHLVFSFGSARELGGFGAKVFGINLLNYASRYGDNVLIGRFLGSAALGAYAVAYNIMLLPLQRIVSPLRGVLFPAFARLQDDPVRAARGWLRANRMVGAITIPAMLGLMVLAPDFIPTVVGSQWDAAIPVVQVLAWVGLVHSLQQLNGSVLQAMDRAGTQLLFTIVSFAAAMSAFAIGLQWGIVGVAASFAVAMTLVQPVYTAATARVLGISVLDVARSLVGVTQAAVAMALVLLAGRAGLLEVDLPRAVRLVVLVVAGCLVYLALCRWRAPEVIDELRSFRRRRADGRAVGAGDARGSSAPA